LYLYRPFVKYIIDLLRTNQSSKKSSRF